MKIEEQIEVVLDKIRPFLNNDGGDVEFINFDDGVAYVRMKGNCVNCELADVTLKDMIEASLMFEIPEIKKIVDIDRSN